TRPRARITSQGQITVPKAVRDRLGLKPGDDVEFVDRDGEIVLIPRRRRSILDFAGALPPGPGVILPKTSAEWKEAIRDSWADAAMEKEKRIANQRGPRRAPGR
ncbi:MAG: AbrB/MazE/SpoVT family DNA-binding domain-containing protein, partial [Chloroflexota bacterium]|nr:AbrB/MazE/SpoVT family DNA-binding domain-containing protein [Chloroflexota bacterium]